MKNKKKMSSQKSFPGKYMSVGKRGELRESNYYDHLTLSTLKTSHSAEGKKPQNFSVCLLEKLKSTEVSSFTSFSFKAKVST